MPNYVEAYADWAINVIDPTVGDATDWINPNNAANGVAENDGLLSTCSPPSNQNTDTLLATWVTGQFNSIPNSARILGLECTIRIKADLSSGDPNNPALFVVLWNGFTGKLEYLGQQVGMGIGAGSTTALTTSLQNLVFGSPTYRGQIGAGTLVPASVVTPTYVKTAMWLGVYLGYDDLIVYSVDSVKMKVYWAPGGGLRSRSRSRRGR